MALPLLFMLAGTLVRAATPAIARAIAQRGAKKIAESGIKGAIKKYGKPKNITSLSKVKSMKGSGASAAAKEVMKKFPVPKNKSLAIPKPKSNVGAKIVAGGATAVTGAAALGTKDKNKGKAKADVKTPKGVSQGSTTAKKKPTTMPKGVSQGSTAGTATTMTFGKAFRAAKDAGKKEFTYRGKRYNTRTKDEEKAMAKNQPLPKAKPKKKKVETPKNVSQGSTTAKKEAPKRKKGFLERFKEDFDKAVKETKRNFQGDAKKGTGRYKSVSTGKTNFNNKKKKAS
jgi:hypothetical protein